MQRLVLLILLLTVVYSWEELKYVLVAIWQKISKQNKSYEKNPELDTLVSDIVVIATIPASLAYLILNSDSLATKLLIMLAEFLILSFLLKGVKEYTRRRKFTADYTGTDRIVAVIFSLSGLVSPSTRFVANATQSTARMGKYLFALALPLVSGLALAIIVKRFGMEEFQAHMDTLIEIATLGIALNITIEILEKLFRTRHLKFTGLMRVALGVAVIFMLNFK